MKIQLKHNYSVKLKQIFLLISVLFFIFSEYSQGQNDKQPANFIIPSSPNAESLGIYGATPVSPYTGVPNISIPIYEINLDGKIIPINLAYHASGIKVNQEASWVGLGWSLNAGGCIVKEVRGSDDFGSTNEEADYPMGYYSIERLPHSTPSNTLDLAFYSQDQTLLLEMVHYGSKDGQPDMFHYNFANNTGSMFIKKWNEQTSPIPKATLKNNDKYLDVTYDTGAHKWIAKDGDGYTYYFNTKEESTLSSTHYTQKVIPTREIITTSQYPVKLTTAWFLDQIVSPKGNSVSFEYGLDEILTVPQLSENSFYMLTGYSTSKMDPVVCCATGCYRVPKEKETSIFNGFLDMRRSDFVSRLPNSQYLHYYCSYSKIKQQYLKKINFNGGSVVFKTSGREDIVAASVANKVQKLDSIIVNNSQGRIKTFCFDYSYTTSEENNSRLFLDKFAELSKNIEKKEYKFSYNSPELLPDKNSFAYDFWGYNNNCKPSIDNDFLLTPSVLYYDNTAIGGVSEFRGKSLLPNEQLMQYGTLNEIQYPTGGKTQFTFEANRFNNSFRSSYVEIPILNIGPSTGYEKNFTVNEPTVYKVQLDYLNQPEHVARLYIYDSYSNLLFYTVGDGDFAGAYTPVIGFVKLQPGNYKIILEDLGIDRHSSAILSKYEPSIVSFGGGLRIKEIIDYDNGKEILKKNYNYTKNGQSSGLLMSTPVYHGRATVSTITQEHVTGPSIGVEWVYMSEFLAAHSSPVSQFSYGANGSAVGYSYVEEQINTLGKTCYEYQNDPDIIDENLQYKFLIGYQPYTNISNGLPISVSYFDNANTLKKKESFIYYKNNFGSIKGFIGYQHPEPFNSWNCIFYDIPSENCLLSKKITEEYFSSDTITTTTDYTYNSVNKLTNKINTIDSKGNPLEKRIFFASDFPTQTDMINKNLLNLPLEEISTKNNLVIYAKKTDYLLSYGNYVPSTIYQLQSSTPLALSSYTSSYKPVLYYEHYNAKGKVQQVRSLNQTSVYLWSYNSEYPIAEIKNATYDDVKAALAYTDDQIQTLANSSAPDVAAIRAKLIAYFIDKPVLVSTYTYKPLVGMVSATDPRGITTTYTYDEFQRLKDITDYNGKLLKNINYHYKE